MTNRSSKKIPVEYGMKDYYKFYIKNYPYKVSRKIYNEVISELHKFIVDEIIDKADDFMLPHRTGYITVVKIKKGVKLLADNTVINNSPPDWKSTNELWEKDPEAAEKKIIVRYKNTHTNGYVYTIKHTKYNAIFKNKNVSSFKAARDFNRGLAKRINDYTKDKYNAHEIKI